MALRLGRNPYLLEVLAMIVHVGPSHLPLPARLGGAVERRMMELAEAQARGGERVMVYSGGTESGWREYHGITIRYLGGPRLEFAWNFVRDVARSRFGLPRVIHVHNHAEIAWLARSFGLGPSVLSCDYPFEPWRRFRPLRGASKAAWQHCLHACDRVAPVSEYCLSIYRDYWNLPRRKWVMIPNGVDCARFRPDPSVRADWRARLGVGDRPLILYVGRLCVQKGSDLLVAAYRLLRHPAALVATGPCERFGSTALSPLVEQLQAAGGLHIPPLDDADMPGIYNACDIFVMPTRDLEMFGMAAVEAQSCGKPVVASDHGGLRETVPDTAGLRFPAGDAAALAAHLDALLNTPDRLAALAAGARPSAARYDWPRVAALCQEVYAAL